MIVLRMVFRGSRGMAAVRRLGARVVLVLQSGGDAHRGRRGDDAGGAEQDEPVAENRYGTGPTTPAPQPGRAHDDVALQHERADSRGLHQLRLAGVRPERGTRGSRQRPQRDRSEVSQDPGRQEHRAGATRENREPPSQLEHRDPGEEDPGGHPVAPVVGHDGEVDHRGADRSDGRDASGQPTVRRRH